LWADEESLRASAEALKFEVTDDGRGGADPSTGSGILGLRDRAEAVGGS
jgi:signal transduction histidine kinase